MEVIDVEDGSVWSAAQSKTYFNLRSGSGPMPKTMMCADVVTFTSRASGQCAFVQGTIEGRDPQHAQDLLHRAKRSHGTHFHRRLMERLEQLFREPQSLLTRLTPPILGETANDG